MFAGKLRAFTKASILICLGRQWRERMSSFLKTFSWPKKLGSHTCVLNVLFKCLKIHYSLSLIRNPVHRNDWLKQKQLKISWHTHPWRKSPDRHPSRKSPDTLAENILAHTLKENLLSWHTPFMKIFPNKCCWYPWRNVMTHTL